MTPFKTDDNPYDRPSVWPRMPQAPFLIGPLPRVTQVAAPPPAPPPPAFDAAAAAEAEMALPEPPPPAAPEPEPRPIAAPIGGRRAAHVSRALRLTPLVAAAALGAGGMAALFLVIGVRPALMAASPPAPEPTASLAAGQMVGQTAAPAPASPAPAPVTAQAIPRPATQVATAKAPPPPAPAARPRGPRAAPQLAAASSATRPASATAPLLLPTATASEPLLLVAPPRPAASLAGPAGPAASPLTPPRVVQPYAPPPPPDRNAPIATHVPD